jgi:multidrug efflux pump subunit AcrA (membrane-fusion protein)
MNDVNVALVDRVIAAAKARAAAKALAELGNNEDSSTQDNSLKDAERVQRRAERSARREQEEALRVQKRAARVEKKQARLNELDQKRAERLVLREQRNLSKNTSTKTNSLSDGELEAAKKISEIMTQFGKDNIYRLVSAAKRLLRHGHVASLNNDVHSISVGDTITIVNWNGKFNGCEGVVKIISRTRAHVELNDRTVYLPIANIVKIERQSHGKEDGTLTPIDDIEG